ncbi:MAG TPA: AMP-binding protein [Nocardioides sp.]|nr:AMP-binding protein [Nocardioides sp.]
MTTLRQLLLDRAADDRPGLATRDRTWTWAEHVTEATARAATLRSLLADDRPPHVGVLLDNTAEMAMALSAAALGGHVVVGLNTTRRGEALLADIRTGDCQLVLTDAAHADLLGGLDLGGVGVIRVDAPEWTEASSHDPGMTFAELDESSLFMLIFTSGTSGDPKAVRVTHEKVCFPGEVLAEMFSITSDDVLYVSMPLFHSNAVMSGYGLALATGATLALAERFSASGFLDDVRHFGATYMNYVGKPLSYVLATPERPDDADNPLRLAFGNEASDKDIAAFATRFGCEVRDGFGSTENAVVISRVEGTPPGSLGRPLDGVKVLNRETGEECPPAIFGPHGDVTNLDECVGELVNTLGAGQFAGYYNDEAATAERMRGGMYWSGDLAYLDPDGFAYYAGRTGDWLRVDGENLAAAPVERILLRHPAISRVAVYAVPDERVGDQLVAALVLLPHRTLDPAAFEEFLAAQPDLGPKQWPRYVRIATALPQTATNKVLKRELVAEGLQVTDPVWTRAERGTVYSR